MMEDLVMLIKKNNESAELFLNQFANYGQNIELTEKKYDDIEKQFYERLKSKQCTSEEFDCHFETFNQEKHNAIKIEEDKNQSSREKLKQLLKNFTQEMLVLIYNNCNNKQLKKELFQQIKYNDSELNYLNTIEIESGAIFEIKENKSMEEIYRIYSIRENDEKLIVDNKELKSMSEQLKMYLSEVINGYDLQDEKEKFFLKHNIENEIEFQIRKKGIKNQKLLESANEVQEALNSLLEINDDSIVNYAHRQMSGIKFNIPGKKR